MSAWQDPSADLANVNAAYRMARDECAHWVRLFNRLDAAISHHHGADAFKDSHDEALYKARAKILADAAQGVALSEETPEKATKDSPR